ncbi:hypothetical protein BUZ73_12515 [Staphylococcus saprophyticus]|nr:hypothetical protein BU009_12685 [Mammaliicoccus sciuri]PTJ63314.1 hypothetical protein BUZ77_12660 [Staphylococcus saprophyticus]PTK00709.1 hypothetical protein BUZ73_12515 [Staphylococcus saprophyticus]
MGLLRVPRLNVNKAIGIKQLCYCDLKRRSCMRFGNYKIDSFWLIMIIGFLATSIFFPFMLLSVIVLLIFGLEKDDKKD